MEAWYAEPHQVISETLGDEWDCLSCVRPKGDSRRKGYEPPTNRHKWGRSQSPLGKPHPENRSSNVPRGIRNRLRSSFAFASRSSPRLITPVFTARDRIDSQTRRLRLRRLAVRRG